MNVRENWRFLLLTALLVLSVVAIFVPGATVGGGEPAGNGTAITGGDNVTNLQYGIQLEGGSRIRAPIVGQSVTGLNMTGENLDALRQTLASELGVPRIDVEVRVGETPRSGSIEVFNRSVSTEEFASAIQSAGFDVTTSDVRPRVTDATREEMVNVIQRKVSASALSGVSVRGATTPTGDFFVVIESTGRDIAELRDILDERGVVRFYAYYQAGNGTFVRQQVLSQDAFVTIGNVERRTEGNRVQYGVSVTITDEAAEPFTQAMQDVGFTTRTVCTDQPTSFQRGCIQATLNGEVVFNGSVVQDLAESFRTGSFADDPTFSLTTNTREAARDVELALKAGQPLPAPLDLSPDAAQVTTLEPALADRFKSNSVIVGLAAVLTVSLVVYYRYGDARVALPMVVTALSEVVILLGFVAVVQFPLNLSHIAGFIAVIGTGVDDLVIIADEVLQREGVTTGRVFQNRFRKAFWVIGAAGATTILAMSPLMVLSLGDLSGFAIITILGVLIGVLITRPAYGDILRYLILEEEE